MWISAGANRLKNVVSARSCANNCGKKEYFQQEEKFVLVNMTKNKNEKLEYPSIVKQNSHMIY